MDRLYTENTAATSAREIIRRAHLEGDNEADDETCGYLLCALLLYHYSHDRQWQTTPVIPKALYDAICDELRMDAANAILACNETGDEYGIYACLVEAYETLDPAAQRSTANALLERMQRLKGAYEEKPMPRDALQSMSAASGPTFTARHTKPASYRGDGNLKSNFKSKELEIQFQK